VVKISLCRGRAAIYIAVVGIAMCTIRLLKIATCGVQSPKRSVKLNDGSMGYAEVITIKVS